MKKFANLYLGLVFLVLYLPIFYLIGYAFNAGDDMNSFTGFSWTHFETMFGDGRLMLILAQTFFLAFLSALIATIIGTFGAIYIYQSRKKYQEAFLSLNNILMVAPDVMIGASFLILFTQLKFSLGFLTVLSSHVAFSIPIVVLMVLPRLKEMNGDMIHAAYDLGASQFQMFKEIMLPYLTPSIITGYFMAFTYSLDDFAVTFSGEASQMLEKNENLRYVVPTEASNLWFDNMVIPKIVKNQNSAYAFINFMLKPENALQNAEYVGYSTPNLPAKELLPEETKEDKAFYPDVETMKHLEVYEKFDHKWTGKYSDLFLQFKMYRK